MKFWPKRVGKRRYTQLLIDRALAEGKHVHTYGVGKDWCEGGNYECPTWQRQLERMRSEAASYEPE